MQVKVFNQNGADLTDIEVVLTVYRPDFEVFAEYTDSYKESINFGKIKLNGSFTNTCFLICDEKRFFLDDNFILLKGG